VTGRGEGQGFSNNHDKQMPATEKPTKYPSAGRERNQRDELPLQYEEARAGALQQRSEMLNTPAESSNINNSDF
jgi:hypothetical protein